MNKQHLLKIGCCAVYVCVLKKGGSSLLHGAGHTASSDDDDATAEGEEIENGGEWLVASGRIARTATVGVGRV